jgi:uncharacterized protein YheU (UPF0270 family)
MQIPHDQLPADTLRAIVEEFVTREGTDYGHAAHSLDEKVEQVLTQIRRGDVLILFDPELDSVTLAPPDG